MEDIEQIKSQQLFNHPDYDRDPKNRTVEQSPKTLETNNEATYSIEQGNHGPNLFVIQSSHEVTPHQNNLGSYQPQANLGDMTRENAAEINMMTMTDPGSLREVAQVAPPTEDFEVPLKDRVLVQPKKLVAIKPNNFDFNSQLRGHTKSPQRNQSNNHVRLDSVMQLQQNISQSTFPLSLRQPSIEDEGRNSNRENKQTSVEPSRSFLRDSKENSQARKDMVVQTGIHGGDSGDETKNTVIMDKEGNCKSELKLYYFPNFSKDVSNRDIKHSMTPHSPQIREEDSNSSKSRLDIDPTSMTPHQKRAIYEGVESQRQGAESQRSSMAGLPEYQLTGKFNRYSIIKNKEGLGQISSKDSMAANTEKGSNFAAVETESGEPIQGHENSKTTLQHAKKPRAMFLTKPKPSYQNAPRRDPFSTSFLVQHREARKNQPDAYAKTKKSMTGFSNTSSPEKSSLHRSNVDLVPQSINVEVKKDSSLEKLLTTHKGYEDFEQEQQLAKLAPAAKRELEQLYKMSNIQKYIAETQVPSHTISMNQDEDPHAFLQADQSIAALDSQGQLNYGNALQFEASRDFIVISDKDAQSRESPRVSIRRRNKFSFDPAGPNANINFMSSKRPEDRQLKQNGKKIFKPQGGGGKFNNKNDNHGINISVDIKNTKSALNRDLVNTKPQYRLADTTQPPHGIASNLSSIAFEHSPRHRSPIVSKINLGALAGLDLDIQGMTLKRRQNNVILQKDKQRPTKFKQEGSDPLIMQVRGQNNMQEKDKGQNFKAQGSQIGRRPIDSPKYSLENSLNGVSEIKSLERKIDQWSHTEGLGALSNQHTSLSPTDKGRLKDKNKVAPFSIMSPDLATETSQETRNNYFIPQSMSGQILINYNQLMEKKHRDQLDALNVYKNSFKNLPQPSKDQSLFNSKDMQHKRSPKAQRKRQIVDMVPSQLIIQENYQIQDMKILLNQATPKTKELFKYNQSKLSMESLQGSRSLSKDKSEHNKSREEDFDSPQVISINMGPDQIVSQKLSKSPSGNLRTQDGQIFKHDLRSPQNNSIKIVPKNFNLSPAPKLKGQNIKIMLQNKRYDTQRLDEAGDQTAQMAKVISSTGSSFQNPVEALDGMNALAQHISQQSEQTLQEESRLADILEGPPLDTPGHEQNYRPEAKMTDNKIVENKNMAQPSQEKKGVRTNIKMIFVNDSQSRLKEMSQQKKQAAQETKHSPEVTMNQVKKSDEGQENNDGPYFDSFGSHGYGQQNKQVYDKGGQSFVDQQKSPPFKISKMHRSYRENESPESPNVAEKESQGLSQQSPVMNPDGLRHHQMIARFQPQQIAIQPTSQSEQKELDKLKQLAKIKEQNNNKLVTDRVAKLHEKRLQLEDGVLKADGSRAARLNKSQDRQELQSFFTKQASINYIPSFEDQSSQTRQHSSVFKSQIQLPKISKLANFTKQEDVRRSNDRIFRSQLRGKAQVRNANRHRTSSVLPKIESVASMSGNVSGLDGSSPSLQNVLSRRYNAEDLNSSQMMPVVSRKQRNHYDRFRFYKSKDQALSGDTSGKKGFSSKGEIIANITNMASVQMMNVQSNVLESKRESQGAVSIENLEPKYEFQLPGQDSFMGTQQNIKDISQKQKQALNNQTLLNSEKRKVFQVTNQASSNGGIKKLPITAQDLDMSNVLERHRNTFDENIQANADNDQMFQLLSETSQKGTLKARGGDDSVLYTNSGHKKILQQPMQSITGINYNPKITSNQEIIEKKTKQAPTQRHSPNLIPLLKTKFESPVNMNKDLTIAVTLNQKEVEIGVQTKVSDGKRPHPIVQIPQQTSRLFRETSGKQLSESNVSRTGPSPSLQYQHSGPGLPMLPNDKSRQQPLQKLSTKNITDKLTQEFRITKEEISVETDIEKEIAKDDPFRPSSTMIIHNLARKSNELMNPTSQTRFVSPQTVLQQANKEKFNQIQKLKQLQTKFQISESVLKKSKYQRRLEQGIQENTRMDQSCGRNGDNDKELNELRSWHSQRDQADGYHKDGSNYFSETRGLNFSNEQIQAKPHLQNTLSKNTSPKHKYTGVMREYGYDKMNSIFMNEKVVEQDQNFGNAVSKGQQMCPRSNTSLLNSPINAQSKAKFIQARQNLPQDYNYIMQGQDTEENIVTDQESNPFSPAHEIKNQSLSLYVGVHKKTSRIDLTDDEMADLERIRHRPDFQSKGLTQSNFAAPSGNYRTGEQTLLGSQDKQDGTVKDTNLEGTQKTHIASISQPGSAIDSYQRNQIIVMQQNNESIRTPIADTKTTELSELKDQPIIL